VRFNFKLFARHMYVALFESRRRGVVMTRNRLVILLTSVLVLIPWFWWTSRISWILDYLLFPKFRKQEIDRPIFIIGNPRSGTTLLHRLMAQDVANFSHFRTWELAFAPSILQRRYYQTVAAIDRAIGAPVEKILDSVEKRTLGSFKLHPIGLKQAEEDDLILLYVWHSAFVMAAFPFPDEIWPEILQFDSIPRLRKRVMRFYRGAIQRHLFIRGRDKHYLSKNPVFSSRVGGLYETFPDARFIYLIRNPLNVIGSVSSYARTVWNDFQGAERDFPYDQVIWDIIKFFYRYTLDWLETIPEDRYMIVRFDDFVSDPKAKVTEIYRHFGFDINEDFDTILEEATQKARAYTSKHSYSFEGTEFTRERIVEEYADLFERFNFDSDAVG